VGLSLLVQTSNRRNAEQAFQKLDQLMAKKYGLTIFPGSIAGQGVTNWLTPVGEPLVTRGWLENNIAFLVIGGPGASLLIPKPQASLPLSPLYREAMPNDEQADDGTLYLDVDRVGKTNLLALLPLPPGGQPLLDALKTIGIERRIQDTNRTLYRTSLQFVPEFAMPQGLPSIAPTFAPSLAPPSLAPPSLAPSISPSTSPGITPGVAPGVAPPAPGTSPNSSLNPSPSPSTSPFFSPSASPLATPTPAKTLPLALPTGPLPNAPIPNPGSAPLGVGDKALPEATPAPRSPLGPLVPTPFPERGPGPFWRPSGRATQ
jgi:hypothetical protein